jgi:hypothetical protein
MSQHIFSIPCNEAPLSQAIQAIQAAKDAACLDAPGSMAKGFEKISGYVNTMATGLAAVESTLKSVQVLREKLCLLGDALQILE